MKWSRQRTRRRSLGGCPGSGAPQCGLPPAIPAQPVATSVAIGPDGAYPRLGELKGFPAPKGESRVWRVQPGARHAVCGTIPACRVVADGFTSIIDLRFGPGGALYVIELDEESWLAMESGQGAGGSVNRCNSSTWVCTQVATGLPMLTSAVVDDNGTVWVVTNALNPATVDISALPLSAPRNPSPGVTDSRRGSRQPKTILSGVGDGSRTRINPILQSTDGVRVVVTSC